MILRFLLNFLQTDLGQQCFHNLFGHRFDQELSWFESIQHILNSVYLIPFQMFSHYVLGRDIPHRNCLSLLISKLLSYTIVTGSAFVKFPQIIKICNAKNAFGISFIAVCIELFAISANMVYSLARNFSFSSWGDTFFTALQTFIIANLCLLYQGNARPNKTHQSGKTLSPVKGRRSLRANENQINERPHTNYVKPLLFSITYVIAMMICSGPYRIVPLSLISSFQLANLPIIVISKVLQILENLKNSGTGQLSALTFILMTGGCFARIYTSIQETGDILVILPYILASVLNSIILLQIFYYNWIPRRSLREPQKPYTRQAAKKRN